MADAPRQDCGMSCVSARDSLQTFDAYYIKVSAGYVFSKHRYIVTPTLCIWHDGYTLQVTMTTHTLLLPRSLAISALKLHRTKC